MFQGGGNIPLLMPIVGRLVSRGHEVHVLAGPGIRPRPIPVSHRFLSSVETAGANLVPFSEPAENPYEAAPPSRGLIGGWMPARLRNMALAEARTTVWSSSWAQNVTRAVREYTPDVLVCDFLLLGAIAAGEAAGLPTACVVHNAFPPHVDQLPPKGLGFAPPRTPAQAIEQRFWRWARERIWTREGLAFHNAARGELGLRPLHSQYQQYDALDRMLVLGHKQFEFPAALMPANVCYTGTPIDDVASAPWVAPWPADDTRPLVLVSLSTLPQGQGPVMQRLMQAISDLPVRALVTLGPSLNREDFTPGPNTVIETFIPHSAVMPFVDAMVTQCGLGSFTKGLINGVPLLCLPLVGDQPDNAARIVAQGAGIRVPADAPVERLRSAVLALLHDPRYRESAERLARIMRATDAEDTAAAELEGLARIEPWHASPA
jgi:UDP:flavonoid glycosyltransferase YjiC (YdhE family)